MTAAGQGVQLALGWRCSFSVAELGMSAAAGGVFSGLGRAWQLRGNPCRCFTADTPVQMADGTTKRICEVQVGDQVLSRDPATGKDEAKTVTFTIERHAPSVVDVTLHDARTGKAETLTCTPEHPLFVQGQGWVEAGSVGIGTSIVSRAGPALEVTDLTWEKNKAEELAAGAAGSSLGGYTVYNLTVEDDHTFFVGAAGGGTWVHNNCPWATPGSLPPNEESDVIDAMKHVDNGTTPSWLHPNARGRFGRPYRNNTTPNGDSMPGTPGAGGYTEYDVNPGAGAADRGPG